MSKIVRATANIMLPFILVFGFYIVIHGHLTPGGGFQGGAVIATGIVLMFAANRYSDIKSRFTSSALKNTETLGLLLFIIMALAAIIAGSTFFYNWLANGGFIFGDSVTYGSNPGFLNTAGTIPIMNIAVGIEVLGAMGLIILYMLSGISREDA
ncbi:MnhB domain-containing protein [Methanochimaera problematica]|nr:MnhB domain-containing protein [Methanoplanus sp. FWC-SCC4]